MRRFAAVTAGFLTLLVVLRAEGQQGLTVSGVRSMVGGVNPQPIQNKVVDTSKALAPMNIANSFRPPRPPATFTLSRFFPKITAGPWPPRLPSLSSLSSLSPFKTSKTPAPTPVKPQQAFQLPQQ